GTERIQPRVDRHVELRQSREVPDDVDFGDFHFVRDLVAHERRGKEIAALRNVERRQSITATALLGMLEDLTFAVGALWYRCVRAFLFHDRGHRRSLATAALSTPT